MKLFTKIIIITLFCAMSFIIPLKPTMASEDNVWTSPVTEFQISEGTNFSIYTKGPTVWTFKRYTTLTYYFNATALASNDSITIISVSAGYNISGREFADFKGGPVINETFTEVNQAVNVSWEYIIEEEDVEDFFITLRITAKNSTMENNEDFYTIFPGRGEDIVVVTEIDLAIIDLPGFPNPETFIIWIIIFSILLISITLPALFTASFKTKNAIKRHRRENKKTKQNPILGGTNDE